MQQDHTVLLVENTPTVGEGQELTAEQGGEKQEEGREGNRGNP